MGSNQTFLKEKQHHSREKYSKKGEKKQDRSCNDNERQHTCTQYIHNTCALVARVDDGGSSLPGGVRAWPGFAQGIVIGDPAGRPLYRRHRRARHRRLLQLLLRLLRLMLRLLMMMMYGRGWRRIVRVHAARRRDRPIRELHVF